MPPIPSTFTVPDLRRPGQAMGAVPVKLPADAIASLQAQADRLGCSRSALARALLVRGLAELDTPSRSGPAAIGRC